VTLASAYCTQSDRPSACVQLRSEHSKVTEIVRALWRRRDVMIAGLMLRCRYSFSTHFLSVSVIRGKNEHLNIETNHGRSRILFPKVGSDGVWRTEVPQQGRGAALRWWSRCEAPRNWRQFLKMVHKYFVYWGFRQHLQQKNTFQHFQGERQVPTLPMPAGVHETNNFSRAHKKQQQQ